MVYIKNIHEKLLNSVQHMLVDDKYSLPYYGNFCLYINFNSNEKVQTCGVRVTRSGMEFSYSPKFLEEQTQKSVNFITIHELFHLLWDHPKRTLSGQYDHKISNVVQDMIINHIIWQDINHNFVEIPKSNEGKNMALFVPKEYDGKLIFEELYEWMKNKKEERKKEKNNEDSEESENGSNKSEKYGPYGKNPSGEGTIDTYSLDSILDDLETNNGEYLDKHLGDDVPSEMRESMIKDVMNKLSARGYSSGDNEATLNKIRKKRKDYIRDVKRAINNTVFGTSVQKTILRPNRKNISGLKGKKKIKNAVNVLLDTSGSMGLSQQGLFEKVLSYVYRTDTDVNMIQTDTEVKFVKKMMDNNKISKMSVHGLGGTILQPGIDHIVKNFNDLNTVILTDGETDSLDFSRIKGKVLVISTHVECPISSGHHKVKQLLVDLNLY